MKKSFVFIIILFMLLSGCSTLTGAEQDYRVGMLVETTVHDQAWGQKGYKGLQTIQDKYDVDVYFKEGVKLYDETVKAVNELVDKGVNVIFGHSNIYGEYFQKLHKKYPDVEFIYFNGQFSAENVTSLNFSAHAMGFFAGMVAGEMTQSDIVGMIAVFEWQPEVEGFYEGVMHQNPQAEVKISYTNSWDDTEKAMKVYKEMKAVGADVFYPAGDLFSIPLIRQMQKDQLHGIGYVSDQHEIAEQTVLTSTVQRVDVVYALAMEKLITEGLPGKVMTFDFPENAIQMGSYSSYVPDQFKEKMKDAVKRYKETGKLPNE